MQEQTKPKAGGTTEVASFAEVLVGPPHAYEWVYERKQGFMWPPLPALLMYCGGTACKGDRNYHGSWLDIPNAIEIQQAMASGERSSTAFQFAVARYVCRNCLKTLQYFSVHFDGGVVRGVNPLTVRKVGQHPAYFVRGSRRVEKLISEDDLELYRKGRRAEGLRLGIAAFAYYRRIIENNKNKLLDKIVEVARETGEPHLIEQLQKAKGERLFSSSMKHMAPMIPERLKINGHNPLSVLHDTFSQGLHALADEKCLTLAHNADVVLGTMLESIDQILADKRAAQAAIHALLNDGQSEG